MRFGIFIIVLFFGLKSVYSQQNTIWFENQIYNFGIIEEDGGVVFHTFTFENRTSDSVKVVSVETGCGCMAAVLSDSIILPGAQGKIQMVYDPAGRFGSFVKSASVTFQADSMRTVRYLNVKGLVINDIEKSNASDYFISLAPFRQMINTKTDTVYKQTDAFQKFVNDITFVIDREGFVNLTWNIKYDKLAGKQWAEQFAQDMAATVKRELQRRNYSNAPAGHRFVYIEENKPVKGYVMDVLLTADKYTDFNRNTSLIERTQKVPVQDTMVFLPFPYRKNLLQYKAFSMNTKWYKAEKNKDALKWIDNLRIKALTNDSLLLGGVIYLPVEKRDESLIKKKIEESVYFHEFIEKELVKQGIPAKKIRLTKPELYTLPVTGFQSAFYSTLSLPEVKETKVMEEDFSLFNGGEYAIKDEYPVQNLPVYKQNYHGKGVRIDTSNVDFQRMMRLVMYQKSQGRKVVLYIESSASNLPTRENFDNFYVAELRAKESRALIESWLVRNGYRKDSLEFAQPIHLIQGPEYNLDYFLHSYYKAYQYIRLIPVYVNPFDELKAGLKPYMINFGIGDMELVYEAAMFQEFAAKLAEVILKQGFVKLKIESSSSKVPNVEGGNNSILAWRRAEDARKKVERALMKYGADPGRLIITEERALVQGPEYKGDVKTRPDKYEPFQYIKLLPEAVLRK